MIIVFICGSLEPGKDGVGDYTRRLAGELMRQGHHTTIIAINDRYTERIVEENQHDLETAITVVRLPYTLRWVVRMRLTKEKLNKVDPEWLSLQYVPFAFQNNGLPFGLARRLKRAGQDRKWHIMFHELWCGIYPDRGTTLKQKFLRTLQRELIIKSIKTLSPSIITTSIPVYQRQLKQFQPQLLPLFGNIPLSENSSQAIDPDNGVKLIYFGTYSGDLKGFKQQLKWIKDAVTAPKMITQFLSIGNGGRFKPQSLAIVKSILGDITIRDSGIRATPEISEELNAAHIGISRADSVLWGKSGTTMAMLEHGLPIVLRGSGVHEALRAGDSTYIEQLCISSEPPNSIPAKRKCTNGVLNTARQFVNLLTDNNGR